MLNVRKEFNRPYSTKYENYQSCSLTVLSYRCSLTVCGTNLRINYKEAIFNDPSRRTKKEKRIAPNVSSDLRQLYTQLHSYEYLPYKNF